MQRPQACPGAPRGASSCLPEHRDDDDEGCPDVQHSDAGWLVGWMLSMDRQSLNLKNLLFFNSNSPSSCIPRTRAACAQDNDSRLLDGEMDAHSGRCSGSFKLIVQGFDA